MKAVIGCLIGLVLSVCASAEPLLEGRVRLASGDAVASAQVQIFDMTDLQRGAVARTTTDGRGYFALPLAALPVRFELGANYPNPFNPSTRIPYQLAASSYVRLEVFNLLGQRIATLVEGERPAGFHAAVWDATDGSGQAVGAGVYLYRLTVGGDRQTGRMVLVDGQAGVAAVGGEGVWSAGIAQDRSYGLVVSGSGIAPYVVADLGIQAGMAPMELVVAAHPAGKVLDDDDFSFDLSDLFNTPAAAAPDLVVSSASASDTTLTAGQAFTLQAKVRNQGDEPSAATVLRYYLSDDATITSGDEEVGTDAIGTLNPSAISGVLISLTAPVSAGTYYYGACVESVSGESDTDNNCSEAVTVTVSGTSAAEEDAPEEDEPPPSDRAALVALYNATDGFNWTNNANWLSDAPIGQWYGVITDGSGRVTELHLDFNQLSGSIPPELGNLANLTGLFLGENQLSGSIPPELGNLTNLTVLYLDFNQLSGSIPPELGNLANLEYLFLFSNQLSGLIPSELGNLANLTVLYLAENQLSGSIPPELGNLANLDELFLSGNQLSGCIPEGLGLRDVEINDLDILGLSFCGEVADDMADDMTDDMAASSPDRDALVVLYNATDGLNWTNDANWLSDAPIGQWHGVITDGSGRVTELHLHFNQLSGSIPPELGNLANLKGLYLHNNQLSGSIPSELGNLANLETLFLGDNQLSGSIPPELGNLANLEWLFLSGNQLSGSIPPELGNLASLKGLNLASNQLSGPIPSELGNLANLEWLYLSGNQLTGCIPGSLRDVETNDLDILGLSFCGDGTTAPDLVVQSASVSNSRLTTGQSFTLSATVRNQGGSWSGPTTLRYYRSSDATISIGDTQVGTDNRVDGLAASGTSSESIRLNAPSSSGTYYYGACLSSFSEESDPNNNCSEGVQVTVTEPDSEGGQVTVTGPDSEGGQVTVQVTTSTGELFGWRYVPHSQRAALTYDGFTALMRAALDGDVDEVRSLWNRASSSERTAQTDDGFTVLMAAALSGDVEVVRFLWDSSSTIRGLSDDETDDGFTVLMAAALSGDIEVVRFLWDSSSTIRGLSDDETDDGFTVLMAAALSGDIEVVRFLWDSSSTIRGLSDDETDDGFTVLMAAALSGDIEVVRFLWDSSSTIRGLSDDETDDGFTVLMAAALSGDIEVVRFLWDSSSTIRGLSDDETDDGFTVLMAAALSGDIEVVRFLWDSSSTVRGLSDDETDDGFTVLMAAALSGDIEVVRFLWDSSSTVRGLSDDETDDGFTVLMAAALSGDIEVVRFLWDSSSTIRRLRDGQTKDGETALSMALKEGHQEVVDFLRSVGAT